MTIAIVGVCLGALAVREQASEATRVWAAKAGLR